MADYPIRHPHSRFHVCCDACHFVSAERSWNDAAASATAHFHGKHVSIFDSMAHRGKCHLWQNVKCGTIAWEPMEWRAQ